MFVQSVRVLLVVERDITSDVYESLVDASEIEASLQSAEATLEEELQMKCTSSSSYPKFC